MITINSHLRWQSEDQVVSIQLGRIPEDGRRVLEEDPPREQVAPIGEVEEGAAAFILTILNWSGIPKIVTLVLKRFVKIHYTKKYSGLWAMSGGMWVDKCCIFDHGRPVTVPAPDPLKELLQMGEDNGGNGRPPAFPVCPENRHFLWLMTPPGPDDVIKSQ